MSDSRERNGRPTPPADGSAPLPKPVQEHLGRELRTTYHTEEAKPAFLGDIGVPAQFESYIERIQAQERRQERVHERGVEAVRAALQEMQINDALAKALDVKKD